MESTFEKAKNRILRFPKAFLGISKLSRIYASFWESDPIILTLR